MAKNRQGILMRRPVGEIRGGDLALRDDLFPKASGGQVVVRTEWLSIKAVRLLYTGGNSGKLMVKFAAPV